MSYLDVFVEIRKETEILDGSFAQYEIPGRSYSKPSRETSGATNASNDDVNEPPKSKTKKGNERIFRTQLQRQQPQQQRLFRFSDFCSISIFLIDVRNDF